MFRPVRPPLLVIMCCLLAGWLGAGCDQLHPGDPDERREANFQAAYNLGVQGLTDDAIKAFYRALEANPHNATAHRELGQIYYDKKHDFVLAVYHLRRSQQIKAARNDREANDYSIEQIIKQSQLQLAIEFNGQIGRQQAQAQFDDLKRRNAELEATVARLSQQLGLGRAATQNPPVPTPKTVEDLRRIRGETKVVEKPAAVAPPTGEPAGANTTTRTHVVKAGENPASIARRYHLTPQQLMAANKGVDARHLRPGQSLKLPEPAR